MENTWRDVTKAARLITLPDVYFRLKSILDDPDFTMAEVAVIISRDPAITFRLLRMVNSSLYGFRTKIETVSRAITLLGTQQIHDLVLATSVAQAFEGISSNVMDLKRFWMRSVYCAVASHHLAAMCSGCDKDRIFVAGLLYDIGHLIMYQAIPDRSQQAMFSAREKGRPLHKVERDILGFDYAEAGAELMQQWSLPESLQETTRFHIEPEKSKKYPLETALIHLGSLLTKANDGEGMFNQPPLDVAPSVWSVTGLVPEDCTSLSKQVEEETGEVLNLISPRENAFSL